MDARGILRSVRRAPVAAGIAAVVVAVAVLTGCAATLVQPVVHVESGYTVVRVSGEMIAPAALFSARVVAGDDDCLYVELSDRSARYVLALADASSVSPEGIVSPDGVLHPFGTLTQVQLPGPLEGEWRLPELPNCRETGGGLQAIAL